MESLQRIKTRLRGVRNISQITKAMELVAATKMRRSEEIALLSRPYVFAALDLLADLIKLEGTTLPPLLEKRPVRRTLFVIVTSDKGLAGAFNSSVIRSFERYLSQNNIKTGDSSFCSIAVGQKAKNYLERRGFSPIASFVRIGDFTTISEIAPIADKLMEGFLKKNWDKVVVFSTHFRTALRQEVLQRELFPATVDSLRETAKGIVPEHGKFSEWRKDKSLSLFRGESSRTRDYLIEPSPTVVLEKLIPHLVRMQIYHFILEANASEHSARRMAMKNASDNADSLYETLNTVYNKSRQAAITKEIIEVTSGAESIG